MIYKNIFLDLDDTLVDTNANAKIALKQIYDKHEINRYYPTFDGFATNYFTHNNHLWDLLSQNKVEKDELLFDRFYNPFKDVKDISIEWINTVNTDYIDCVESIEGVIDGTFELLDYLKGKYGKLYLLSNGFTDSQVRKINSAKLNGYFEECFYSDAVGANKPHAEFYQHVLDKIGANATDSIMIGDNIVTDISGANNMGIATIWYNAEGKQTKDGIKPTYTVSKLEQIKAIL